MRGWMRTGTILKLLAGIGVGMGIRVTGTVGDGYKYLFPCSSLTTTTNNYENLYSLITIHYDCAIWFGLCYHCVWIQLGLFRAYSRSVAVLRWGQGGHRPPNLAQAPQIFGHSSSATG